MRQCDIIWNALSLYECIWTLWLWCQTWLTLDFGLLTQNISHHIIIINMVMLTSAKY